MTKIPSRKSESKRAYLIEQATRCLAQKGYAHVSLRDIARESGVSLGILHYYFSDKEELLAEVIRTYKNFFILRLESELDRYDDELRRSADEPGTSGVQMQSSHADGAENLTRRLLSVLRNAFLQERENHRLWYDFQVLAMYQPVFRQHVAEIRSRFIDVIKRVLIRLDADRGAGVSDQADRVADGTADMPDPADRAALDVRAAQLFAMLDGLFFQALQEDQEDPEQALARFEQAIWSVVKIPLS